VLKVRLVAVFGAFLIGAFSSLTFSGCGGNDAPVSAVPAGPMTPEQKDVSDASAKAHANDNKK